MSQSTENKGGRLNRLLGYNLRRAYRAFEVTSAQALADTDIRPPLFGAMAIISETPAVRPSVVAFHMGIQKANIVAVINELVERGLVERSAAPEDRRAQALTLTAQGQQVFSACVVRIRKHEKTLLAGFTAAESRTLHTLLARIAAKAPPRQG